MGEFGAKSVRGGEEAMRIKLRDCGWLSSLARAFPGRDYGITASDDKGIEESVSQDGQQGRGAEEVQ